MDREMIDLAEGQNENTGARFNDELSKVPNAAMQIVRQISDGMFGMMNGEC
jgi:hypothetical protein